MEYYSIAIDGPAGAGKSTIAKRVAARLSFIYVDTGAMYRAVGLYYHEKGTPSDQVDAIARDLDDIHIDITYENGEQQLILNGRNVNALIRSTEASRMASAVSVHPCIRYKMVSLQQALAKTTSVVMDGRDIGTYVLPDATLKIYLDAKVEVRAKRRWLELEQKGEHISIESLQEEIHKRDMQDMTREFAPLSKAADAVVIDTSDMTIDEVVDRIAELYREKV